MSVEEHVLLVVDVQNDFLSGGSLAVPRSEEIIPPINRLAKLFSHVILTQDWHPKDHFSFASNNPGKKPYETITASYGSQILWPDHCVQHTRGAEFSAALEAPRAEMILRKGYNRTIDSYSAFYENDHVTPTGLTGYLRQRGFSRIFIAGLAFDFCVRWSAEDAHRDGFDVAVIEDACRSIDIDNSSSVAREILTRLAVPMVDSRRVTEMFGRSMA